MPASADSRSTARLAAFRRLRETPWRYVFSISGGGSAFLSDYLALPGASASFLEGLIPYSPEATNAFLGFRPENYSSERTARLLASAALRRARTLAAAERANARAASKFETSDKNNKIKESDCNAVSFLKTETQTATLATSAAENSAGKQKIKTTAERAKNRNVDERPQETENFDLSAFSLVGVGATASLVSDRPKRGEHRIFCAVETLFETFSATLTLDKGARDRAAEERLAADFILTVLLFAAKNAVDRLAALGIAADVADSERSTALDAVNSGDLPQLNVQTILNAAKSRLSQERAAVRDRLSASDLNLANAAEPELSAPFPPLSPTVWREFSAPIPPSELLPLTSGDVASISWTTLDAVGSAFLFDLDSTSFPRPFPKIAALRFDAGKVNAVRFAPAQNQQTQNQQTQNQQTQNQQTQNQQTQNQQTQNQQTQNQQTQNQQTQNQQTQNQQTKERQDLTTTLFDICDNAPSTVETLYPGSFNPPHRAHRRVAELAAEKTGAPVAFELSVRNVDKPSLDALEISRRLKVLQEAAPNVPIWTTNAPRFVEKAALFPGSTFALGTDSVVRLGDAKYENGSTSRRDAVLERLTELGARFLVFTRKLDGAVQAPESLPLPEKLRTLCEFVPPEEFLDDVSSTALRRKTQR